jgi:ATP-dependent Clp protease ATP-binding subunit ClpB
LEVQAEENDIHNDIVEAEDIATIISKWTGIPASKLVASEIEKLADLENILKKRVI